MINKVSPLILKSAKFISNLFNPVFSLLVYFIFTLIKYETFLSGLIKFFLLLIMVILPVYFWIFKRVKSGKYSDRDVSNREERKTLYYFIIGILGVFILINYFIFNRFDPIMLYLFLLLLLMQVSNLFIKSSMHTALNVFTAALFFSQNHTFGFIWLMISIIVGITRIVLKKHTLQEVISGFFIAVIVSSLFLNFN